MRWGRNLILILIGIMGWCGLSGAAENMPFRPGEKLHFRVYWVGIQAGEATLEILPFEQQSGVTSYHFVMTAKTFPFVDMFYKVRDRIESFVDIEMSHALLYKEKKEGKRSKEVYINFDWQKKQVQYIEDGDKREPIALLAGSFDPLSVFYFFRMHELKENSEFSVPVSDGKECVIGKAKVLKQEKVQVASGEYDTYIVEPSLEHIGGVFQKSPDANVLIWVTADARRIPVKIKSKVVVGSFTAELDNVETP